MEYIIKILSETVLLIIILYFVFYKSLIKSLGNEIAKLSTINDLTQIKESVKKEFNESLESYKSKLNEELSHKIEPLRAELNKQSISHQIQYSFLHQERGKVIVELYKMLQELYSAMADWTSPVQMVNEGGNEEKENKARIKRANDALNNFQNYYYLNKLFFPNSFCISIEKLIKFYKEKGWDFGFYERELKGGSLDHEYFKEYSITIRDISNELQEKIPPLISEIERLCRDILGIND